MDIKQADPKGLIRESYRIEGISLDECRSIFMDWALSLPVDADSQEAIRTVLLAYEAPQDHPMSLVLAEGLDRVGEAPARRGGWRGRRV
ncbi:MAG: hypothetical protein JXR35_08120 [Rhodobacteraceae bacterium]|nr:hypothetical protein [Paracoccaceae bacterium]